MVNCDRAVIYTCRNCESIVIGAAGIVAYLIKVID